MKVTKNIDTFREASVNSREVTSIKTIPATSNTQSGELPGYNDRETQYFNKCTGATAFSRLKSDMIIKQDDRCSSNNSSYRKSTKNFLESRRRSIKRENDLSKSKTDTLLNNISTISIQQSNRISIMKSAEKAKRPKSLSGANTQRRNMNDDSIENKASNLNSYRPYASNLFSVNSSQVFSVNDSRIKPIEIKERIEHISSLADHFLKEGVGNKNLTHLANNCFVNLKLITEKAFSRFVLLPDTEKDFVDSLLITNKNLLDFVKTTQVFIRNLQADHKKLHQQLDEKNKDIQNLKTNIEQLRKEIMTPIDRAALKKSEDLMKEAKGHTEHAERIWIVEKQQMAADIERLCEEVKRLQTSEDVIHQKKKYEILKNMATNEVKRLTEENHLKAIEITKLESWVVNAKKDMNNLNKEFKELKEKYKVTVVELESTKESHKEYFELQNRYREIGCMAKEDVAQLRLKYHQILQMYKNSIVEYAELQGKFIHLKKMFVNAGGFRIEQATKDLNLVKEVQDMLVNTDHSVKDSKMQTDKEKTNQNSQEQAQTSGFLKNVIAKPSLFEIIQQESIGPLSPNTASANNNSSIINIEFLALVRGIFDSKYNEFTYCNDYLQYTPFVDFVYNWLNSFCICPIQKQVRVISNQDNISVKRRKQEFIQFLSSPYVDKLWDLSIFREFIEGKFSEDELLFYLHSRYVLFQGPQLQSFPGAAVNVINWIQFERFEATFTKVLPGLNKDQVEMIKEKLLNRARFRKGKTFIDSALVLKVLLELYRAENAKKLEDLREDFLDICIPGEDGQIYAPYDRFHQFMLKKFPFVLDIDIIRLYREAWVEGHGIVNNSAFMIVARKNDLFVESFKQSFCKDLLIPKNNQNQTNVKPLINFLQPYFNEISNSLCECKAFAGNLGLSKVISSIIKKEEQLAQWLEEKRENLGLNVYNGIMDLARIIIKIRNQYCFVQKYIQENETEWIRREVKYQEATIKSIIKYVQQEKSLWIEKEKSVRKIQRFFKRKKANWYTFMRGLINKVENEKNSNKIKNSTKNAEKRTLDQLLEKGIVDLL